MRSEISPRQRLHSANSGPAGRLATRRRRHRACCASLFHAIAFVPWIFSGVTAVWLRETARHLASLTNGRLLAVYPTTPMRFIRSAPAPSKGRTDFGAFTSAFSMCSDGMRVCSGTVVQLIICSHQITRSTLSPQPFMVCSGGLLCQPVAVAERPPLPAQIPPVQQAAAAPFTTFAREKFCVTNRSSRHMGSGHALLVLHAVAAPPLRHTPRRAGAAVDCPTAT